jgi:hypothetical protein
VFTRRNIIKSSLIFHNSKLIQIVTLFASLAFFLHSCGTREPADPIQHFSRRTEGHDSLLILFAYFGSLAYMLHILLGFEIYS